MIFSFTAPVAVSVTGVLAKTVKMSARPPLLWKNERVVRAWRMEQGLDWAEGGEEREMEECLIQIFASVEGIVFYRGWAQLRIGWTCI